MYTMSMHFDVNVYAPVLTELDISTSKSANRLSVYGLVLDPLIPTIAASNPVPILEVLIHFIALLFWPSPTMLTRLAITIGDAITHCPSGNLIVPPPAVLAAVTAELNADASSVP